MNAWIRVTFVGMSLTGWSFTGCYAKSLEVGVAGGIRTTNDLLYGVRSESKPYAVGPILGIGLPSGFGIAIEALYRRVGYQASARLTGPLGLGSEVRRVRTNSWEFPILGTYRVPSLRIKPSVEAGFAPRVMSGLPDNHGFVAGAGVQYGIGHLSLWPALRYTRWNNDFPSGASAQDQMDFLLRVTWKVR